MGNAGGIGSRYRRYQIAILDGIKKGKYSRARFLAITRCVWAGALCASLFGSVDNRHYYQSNLGNRSQMISANSPADDCPTYTP